jgi:hypothetical protein
MCLKIQDRAFVAECSKAIVSSVLSEACSSLCGVFTPGGKLESHECPSAHLRAGETRRRSYLAEQRDDERGGGKETSSQCRIGGDGLMKESNRW